VAGFCEQVNEPSVSIKGGEFLNYLSGYWLLKKDSSSWSYEISVFVFSAPMTCFLKI
jgi:hypothetical protein